MSLFATASWNSGDSVCYLTFLGLAAIAGNGLVKSSAKLARYRSAIHYSAAFIGLLAVAVVLTYDLEQPPRTRGGSSEVNAFTIGFVGLTVYLVAYVVLPLILFVILYIVVPPIHFLLRGVLYIGHQRKTRAIAKRQDIERRRREANERREAEDKERQEQRRRKMEQADKERLEQQERDRLGREAKERADAERARIERELKERTEREQAEQRRHEQEEARRAKKERPAAREAVLLFYAQYARRVGHRFSMQQLQDFLQSQMGDHLPYTHVVAAGQELQGRLERLAIREETTARYRECADFIGDLFSKEMFDLYLHNSMGDHRSIEEVREGAQRLRRILTEFYEESPLRSEREQQEAKRAQHSEENAEMQRMRSMGLSDELIELEMAERRLRQNQSAR